MIGAHLLHAHRELLGRGGQSASERAQRAGLSQMGQHSTRYAAVTHKRRRVEKGSVWLDVHIHTHKFTPWRVRARGWLFVFAKFKTCIQDWHENYQSSRTPAAGEFSRCVERWHACNSRSTKEPNLWFIGLGRHVGVGYGFGFRVTCTRKIAETLGLCHVASVKNHPMPTVFIGILNSRPQRQPTQRALGTGSLHRRHSRGAAPSSTCHCCR